jgi:iron(III) transport system substrate-binding protein
MFIRLASAVMFLAVQPLASVHAAEINIYTTREAGLIEPIIAQYEAKTGVIINVVFMKDGMAERVQAEGGSSPADLMMAVDVGNLIDLTEKGLTQPIDSAALKAAIPPALRAADDQWFGLSWRARVLYAAKELGLKSFNYENLADPQWQGKICIRSGQHPYNTALVAAYIAHYGEARTEEWINGLKANLARKPGGGDRDVAKDILGGICEIGVGNSYYVGLMRSGKGGPEQAQWGEAIDVILPAFKDGGTHINISGAALAKNAPNKAEAVKFLEYLVTDEAQLSYAHANFEYPVKPGVPADPIVASFGEMRADSVPLTEIVKHRKEASQLINKTGFDN